MQQIKYIHIIIGILLIGIVFIFINLKLRINPTSNAPQAPTTIPSKIVNQSDSVVFQIDPNLNINKPDLPMYSISSPPEEDVVKELGQTFGLSDPKKIALSTTEKYVWLNEQRELSYYPLSQHYLFTNSQILEAKAASFDQTSRESILFIKEKFKPSEMIEYVLIKKQFLKSNGNVSRLVSTITEANLTEVEFRYTLDGLPLYLPPYESPDFQTKINQSGIRQIKMKLIPSVTKMDSVKIMDFDQAKLKLSNNQGFILKVNDLQQTDGGPLFNTSEMIINSTSLGYVRVDDKLVPSYIFVGLASNNEDPLVKYSIEVAVPALR